MNVFAVFPAPNRAEELSIDVMFMLFVTISFIWVTKYATLQVRAHRLINGVDAPRPFTLPGRTGWLFTALVLGLLFSQSPLYMLLVVGGLAAFLWESKRTAREQFGLDRLSPARLLQWSLLICGAVVFVELPLSQIVDGVMNAIHLPHPEQESVEMFRRADRPGEIAAFLIQAVLISPMIEELFFRGFLFSFLKNYTTTAFALVLSAGVFAFAHANLGSVLQLWVLGLALGLAYEHTGSLLLPIGIHACWNFLTAMSLLLERGGT
jgi:membrane protease YdiL (CAAX protease family)